jgi:outer membrane biosynthesis protein TonB
MIELFIKAYSCTEGPKPTPSLGYDEVSYKEEETLFPKGVIRKTRDELESLIVEKTEPKFPQAARAVRASGKVLVLILVDEKGNVVKTVALEGHPLLRAASENTIKSRKYKPLKENKKPVKFGGKVVVDWDTVVIGWDDIPVDMNSN